MTSHADLTPAPALAARSLLGGLLMGLANLVPGISGGTMLLAAGIYPRFISAIAEITTLKFRRRSMLVLVCVVIAAAAAILLLSGTLKSLVVEHRWVMYSIFIGLTLGGVPIVWRQGRPPSVGFWVGAGAGLVAMAAIAVFQMTGAGTSAVSGGSGAGWAVLFLGGLAGASAMVLPGVSGGYLLLVLGLYVPILASIDRFKSALTAVDARAGLAEMHVLIPVGLGVLAGVVGVSHAIRLLLERFEKPTLGVLLGLLVGAVAGLYPFQRAVEPRPGEAIKGQTLTAETAGAVPVEDWPSEFFTPAAWQVAAALGLIILGIGVTAGVAHVGRERKPASRSSA